jgi:BolA family transcriptional regulator, general stress-responsive regulator
MNRLERVESILRGLEPEHLEVIDETYLHKGHREASDAEYTHIKITISDIYSDNILVQKHRKIKNLLKNEFESGLHSVTISFK